MDAAEVLWAALGPEPTTSNERSWSEDDATGEVPEVQSAAEVPAAAVPAAEDEWADLRQMLAGDDDPAPVVEDHVDELEPADEADEVDEVDDESAPDIDDDVIAELWARIDELAEALDAERAERIHLAEQLDTLARETDNVLAEAMAEERQRRAELEETLRQVQSSIAEVAPATSGSERRSGDDRRTDAERRRGLAPRPLQARGGRRATDVQPETVVEREVEPEDEDDALEEHPESPSVWKSRLHDVAGSVSSWTADDVDRLRADK